MVAGAVGPVAPSMPAGTDADAPAPDPPPPEATAAAVAARAGDSEWYGGGGGETGANTTPDDVAGEHASSGGVGAGDTVRELDTE